MIKNVINKLLNKKDLTEEESYESMDLIMKGKVSESQIAGFLVGLKMKGETIEEITGCARAMRDNAIKVNVENEYVMDTCGTGGDGGKTFNISTAVAIVAASAGIKIAKHGNVAVSSKSGSVEVLSKLGVNTNLNCTQAKECIDKAGITFLFAQNYHTAMKHAAGTRKDLGTRTIFNILGPLTNPAYVKGQIVGVYDENLTNVIGRVLVNLGCKRAMVVHGNDGLDEITTTGQTKVSEVRDGQVEDYLIDPRDYGIQYAKPEEIGGNTPQENSRIILDVLQGQEGHKRDIVLLNAGAAIYVGEKSQSIEEGIRIAKELIDSGKAYRKLIELVQVSNSV